MRSKIAQRILDETPAHTRIFVKKYGDIVVRVYQLLREKGITQKELAARLGKTPSEISKWLSGNHNLTLQSLAKLEAELGEEIIQVPGRDSFQRLTEAQLQATAPKAGPVPQGLRFEEVKENKIQPGLPPIAA